MRFSLRLVLTTVVGALALTALGAPAFARSFPAHLKPGTKGGDVKALQIRVAGWYPAGRQRFRVDGVYGKQTAAAVENFERHYGIAHANGVASRATFRKINGLADPDGSTKHFNWSEFKQHSNSSCSSQANAYAGTFAGGLASPVRAKRNVRRLMWRLEAFRAKEGGHSVGINSGFRSLPYNACIGGATASQHLYGTAADNRAAGTSNSKARKIARHTQFSGIACYSYTTHNHFDIRLENKDFPGAQTWWWPHVDGAGRELDETGRPCWGESGAAAAASSTSSIVGAVSKAIPGVGALVPSSAEVEAFESAGEPDDLHGAD